MKVCLLRGEGGDRKEGGRVGVLTNSVKKFESYFLTVPNRTKLYVNILEEMQ